MNVIDSKKNLVELLNNKQISELASFLMRQFLIKHICCLTRPKAKSDENGNNNESSLSIKKNEDDTDSYQAPFELEKSRMRSSNVRTLALGYLESLMQIRICLRSKQKTLNLRQT